MKRAVLRLIKPATIAAIGTALLAAPRFSRRF